MRRRRTVSFFARRAIARAVRGRRSGLFPIVLGPSSWGRTTSRTLRSRPRLPRHGKTQGGCCRFLKALAESSDDWSLWYLASRAHYELGKWNDAIQESSRAITLNPDGPWGWSIRAYAHAESGHWAEAARDFTKLVELQPQAPELRAACLLARLAVGDTEGYRSDCQALLKQVGSANAPEVAALVATSFSLRADAKSGMEATLRLIENAVKSNPDDRRCLLALGAMRRSAQASTRLRSHHSTQSSTADRPAQRKAERRRNCFWRWLTSGWDAQELAESIARGRFDGLQAIWTPSRAPSRRESG